MANSIALIEKYLTKAIDTVFAEESKTALLENGSKYIDLNFQEAGYVKILSILMDGLSDYYRVNHEGVVGSGAWSHDNSNNTVGTRDGYGRGSTSATWEVFKLNYDRGKQFLVDSMDNEETAGLVIANLLTEFLRTKVIPEVDALRFSTIAGYANKALGNLVEKTIEQNKILADFNSAFEWLSEHEVPEDEQIIFISPAVETLILNSTEITKFITQADFTSEKGITFKLKAYMGRPIVTVPSSRFFTNIVIDKTNGYYPSANSKVINYLICSRKAVVPVVKLNKSKIWTPETQDDFDGYKVNLRLYHDTFVPKNKIVGCYACVSETTATTKTAKVDVSLSKGSAENAYVVNGVYSTPAGMLGTLITSKNTFALGNTVVVDGETIKVVKTDGSDNVETEAKVYFALIDGANKVIAVSNQITLTGIKKA